MNRVHRQNNYKHPANTNRVRESDFEAMGCAEDGCNQDGEEIIGLVSPDDNEVIPILLCSRHYEELLKTWYDRNAP